MERLVISAFFVVDAIVFMVLLNSASAKDIDIRLALFMTLASAAGSAWLGVWLQTACGLIGIPIAIVISTVLFGRILCHFIGIRLKLAIAFAGFFAIVHVGFGITYSLTF